MIPRFLGGNGVVWLLISGLGNLENARADEFYVPFQGDHGSWHDGFARYDFVMEEGSFDIQSFQAPEAEKFGVGAPAKGQRRCIVVIPKVVAKGNPWSWQGCYWDHEPQTEVELLRRGFHIAFITPDPGKEWDAWYRWLTEKHGLSKKPAFVGMSKGGVNEYEWTTANPDKVSCIYADNPAIRPGAFSKLGDLAANDVSLLNVCGSYDFLLQRHTLPIEARYHELGGMITVIIKDGTAHHPHSLRNPKLIADWMVEHLQPGAAENRPALMGENLVKTYYYGLECTNIYLKEENTFANCRGPGFTRCYERYDAKTESQWGVTGLTIIAPQKAAPGKPWVFRADAIGRDAQIDQDLLAKGFHIVVAPITSQAGPVRIEWEATYKKMVENGFSTKPVMEGSGTGAGEAYTWAIENPDKVSCICARNAAMRSLITKTPLLDKLGSLANAKIPLLHICDRFDPWFVENTQRVESRYRELGGDITVIRNKREGSLLESKDRTRAVEFITDKVRAK